MFFSSSVSPPSYSVSFCSCVERERGGKISLKEEKQVKSQHGSNAELTAYKSRKAITRFSRLRRRLFLVWQLTRFTPPPSVLTSYMRVRPTKKLSLCQPERQLFSFVYIFCFFLHFWMCPHSPDWIDCFPFRKPIEKKEFFNPSCRRHSISESFHPECLRRPRHYGCRFVCSYVLGTLCDTSISAMYNWLSFVFHSLIVARRLITSGWREFQPWMERQTRPAGVAPLPISPRGRARFWSSVFRCSMTQSPCFRFR